MTVAGAIGASLTDDASCVGNLLFCKYFFYIFRGALIMRRLLSNELEMFMSLV